MQDIKNTDKIILIILIILAFVSYAIGFILGENSAGGAVVDFEYVKRNIITFKDNSFFEAIKLTATKDSQIFQSTRSPGFYVFNKYLNPFTNNMLFHQTYITLLSLLIPLLLFLNLKIKFKNTNVYLLALLSSVMLLSPYFRSSAFWGIEENFGIVMVGFSALFLQLYKGSKSKYFEMTHLVLLALFSSLCVYADQKLIIIPLITLISVMIMKNKIPNKLFLIFMYILFSIPFLYLIILWGSIVPTGDADRRNFDLLDTTRNYHHFGYSISIVSFYLFPFFFSLKDKKKKLLDFIKNKENYFFLIIFIFYLIYFLFYYNLDNINHSGGGVFRKISDILFKSVIIQKIILALIFLFSWILILIFSQKEPLNFFILTVFPVLSIFISPALFQEYFDPLIYFLILIYISKKFFFNFKSAVFIFLYFTLFLFIAIFYYR